jgi:hypothetical protein
MRTQYYQVTGRGPWTIDYPGGDTKAHRPGQIIGPIAPTNRGVIRGLRTNRLRQLSEREATAMRNTVVAPLTPLTTAQAPTKTGPKKAAPDRNDTPTVIVDDPPRPKQ